MCVNPCSDWRKENLQTRVRSGSIHVYLRFLIFFDMILTGNLLLNWGDVFAIVKPFNNLERLSLACNSINDFISSSFDCPSMTSLTYLNLNSTNIASFKTVHLIGKGWLDHHGMTTILFHRERRCMMSELIHHHKQTNVSKWQCNSIANKSVAGPRFVATWGTMEWKDTKTTNDRKLWVERKTLQA